MTASRAAIVLDQNLLALDQVQPELARRLRLPAGGTHVRVEREGARYLHHQTWMPLQVSAGDLAEIASRQDLRAPEGPLLVFGIGLGETLSAVLETAPTGEVIAWDRDPWLVRLALTLNDYSAAITSGRLRLAMGADLLELRAAGHTATVAHPLLGRVYAQDACLLSDEVDVEAPRVALCLGDLFVDDLAVALRREGYAVVSIDPAVWSVEELDHALGAIRPQFIAAINYTHGLSRFCHERETPLLCWEIDPSTDRLLPVQEPTESTWMFTWRAAHVPLYRTLGFENVAHVPLGSDIQKRRPLELSQQEREEYGAPVAFVGSSLVRSASRARGLFLELYAAWHPGGSGVREAGEAELDSVLEAQRADYSVNMIPALCEERFPSMLAAVRSSEFREEPVALVAEIAAAEKRLQYCADLGPLGLQVWGDEEWAATEEFGVRYRGPAGHHEELTRIYAGAGIHVDVGRLYQSDIVTMRVFDVLACGGFLIAERSADLERLFEIGSEVEAYSTLSELKDKVAWYLAHPDEAREIGARGRRAVCERHTIAARLSEMLDAMGVPRPSLAGAVR